MSSSRTFVSYRMLRSCITLYSLVCFLFLTMLAMRALYLATSCTSFSSSKPPRPPIHRKSARVRGHRCQDPPASLSRTSPFARSASVSMCTEFYHLFACGHMVPFLRQRCRAHEGLCRRARRQGASAECFAFQPCAAQRRPRRVEVLGERCPDCRHSEP